MFRSYVSFLQGKLRPECWNMGMTHKKKRCPWADSRSFTQETLQGSVPVVDLFASLALLPYIAGILRLQLWTLALLSRTQREPETWAMKKATLFESFPPKKTGMFSQWKLITLLYIYICFETHDNLILCICVYMYIGVRYHWIHYIFNDRSFLGGFLFPLPGIAPIMANSDLLQMEQHHPGKCLFLQTNMVI